MFLNMLSYGSSSAVMDKVGEGGGCGEGRRRGAVGGRWGHTQLITPTRLSQTPPPVRTTGTFSPLWDGAPRT